MSPELEAGARAITRVAMFEIAKLYNARPDPIALAIAINANWFKFLPHAQACLNAASAAFVDPDAAAVGADMTRPAADTIGPTEGSA